MSSKKNETFSANSFCATRRKLIAGAIAASARTFAYAAEPNTARPQPGDILVFADGEQRGATVAPGSIGLTDSPKFAYPKDPATGIVRDGSRLNLLLLVRVPPEQIEAETQTFAADGILAYSAICTHYGCQITLREANSKGVVCNCHGSTFDVTNKGAIVVGPATRRLAALPLKLVEETLVVAAGFSGRLGPPTE